MKKVLEYIKLSYYFFTRCLTSHETQTILTFPYQFHSKTESRTNLCTDFVHGTSISNTPGRIGIWDNMPCVNLKFVCFVAKCVFMLLTYIDCILHIVDFHFYDSNSDLDVRSAYNYKFHINHDITSVIYLEWFKHSSL